MWKIFSSTRSDAWTKVCSVFQKWDTGKYTYNFKELLTCHPRVEPTRIGQYHESDLRLPGDLVDKGARPHSLNNK